jgi:hypothetical protein
MNGALEHFPLSMTNAFIPDETAKLSGDVDGEFTVSGRSEKPALNGTLVLDSAKLMSPQYAVTLKLDHRPVQLTDNRLLFKGFSIYSSNDNPFTVDGYVDMSNLTEPLTNLTLKAQNYELINAPRTKESLLYGKMYVSLNSTIKGTPENLRMRGVLNVLKRTDITYVMTDSPLSVQDRLGDMVEFTSFSDTLGAQNKQEDFPELMGIDMQLTIRVDETARVQVDLSSDRSNYVSLQGGGQLSFTYTPQGDMNLSGRYTLSGGTIRYALPIIPLKEFAVTDGSYVEWTGNAFDPSLNLKAVEKMQVSVPNESGNGSSLVDFDVSIEVKNRLNNLALAFNLAAPENGRIQDQINAMDDAERNKQAITLMATGMYLAGGRANGNFDMGSALNSVLQSQIASLAGSALKSANISLGVKNYEGEDGSAHTAYNFSYAQRFFNDRVQVVVGGSISSGANSNESDSDPIPFINNISLEYRLDDSGTRYVRLFRDKEYENMLENEITSTGVGLVLRKKVNRLGDLFIFRRQRR